MSENKKINRALEMIARQSIDKSSQVLSKMIKTGAKIVIEDVYLADISEITEKNIASGDDEVVGAYIDLVGDTPFKFLFFVGAQDSLTLADLMLRRAVGTTKEFDVYASSAVQEIGNILSSAITNVFASDFQISLKPKPPVVVHDFSSTLFQEYIMSCSTDKDEILIIESKFLIVVHNINCQMFILPAENSESVINYISKAI